jgi:peptidyl-prolyl cis-trans isomerase A (cyclophilin A)
VCSAEHNYTSSHPVLSLWCRSANDLLASSLSLRTSNRLIFLAIAIANLVLRILSMLKLRLIVLTLLAALVSGSSPTATADTIVAFDFANFGTVQVELFNTVAPVTVANFLNYVTSGRYDASMIHRVDTGLGVIQGGGFTSQAQPIATDPLIPLEYSLPNTRGTIAMARFFDSQNPSNTTTASSQWFINTHDNSTVLNQSNGGGYAVFGQVLGNGMDVIDAIAAVPTFSYADPFSQVPLQNFTATDKQNGVNPIPHVVVLNSVMVVPEPGGLALLGVGLASLLAFAVKMRKRRLLVA